MVMMGFGPLLGFTALIGAFIGALGLAMQRRPSVLDRLEPADDTEARIAALTRKVRRRARVASWLKG